MSRSLEEHATLARARAVPWDEQRARRVARQLDFGRAERKRTAGQGLGALQLVMMAAAGVAVASLLVRLEPAESAPEPSPSVREASESAGSEAEWVPLGDGGLEASASLEPISL